MLVSSLRSCLASRLQHRPLHFVVCQYLSASSSNSTLTTHSVYPSRYPRYLVTCTTLKMSEKAGVDASNEGAGQPVVKTAKQLKKEAQKQEKMKKFQAKQAKKEESGQKGNKVSFWGARVFL